MKKVQMKTMNLRGWLLALGICWATVDNALARPVPDASNPTGFFMAVADKVLRSTFPFGVTNIPVCSNGVFVYTPAVQRLLQLSANIYDAANTNAFPIVFRPLFANDAASNLFIIGYQQVTNVSGPTDPELASPYDFTQLSTATTSPIADAYGPVNVYGVPWIIGAKKGLPGFNQFSMVNAVTVTRKLEVERTTTDPITAIYWTNQMYLMSISNNVGVSFWNPYNAAYPRPVTVYAKDLASMTLTNDRSFYASGALTLSIPGYPNGIIIPSWPGSQWTGNPPNADPSLTSFLPINWSFTFLNPSIYRFNSNTFESVGSLTSSGFETSAAPLPQLPQFGLSVTNYLQAFILDGSNVIDYVQLRGPASSGNLNWTLADPAYPDDTGIYYQWSTNDYPFVPAGVANQLFVSGHYQYAPAQGGQWGSGSAPVGFTTPSALSALFDGFFTPTFFYNGQVYVNSYLAMQAPYTPTRTVVSSYLLQANDPLVHYLASDLNSRNGALAIWANMGLWQNGTWNKIDDLSIQPLPISPATPIGGRYQPWGQIKQMAAITFVDTNAYNLADKDPLIWGPDNWNFPTNLLASLDGLGQVHRGSPWQTIYLKPTNVLAEYMRVGNQALWNIGTNTWMAWTGDFDAYDAALMAPVSDWRLSGLLMSVLNTNDATQLFSVNDPNIADWQNVFNGLVVYSNSTANPIPIVTPTFDTYLMASNSPQALVVANGVANIKAASPVRIIIPSATSWRLPN